MVFEKGYELTEDEEDQEEKVEDGYRGIVMEFQQ